MLGFYATRLGAVEINNTFYRMPKADLLERWRDAVPGGFRFALKASRRITHHQRLKDAGDSVDHLFRTAEVLGEHLGPFLFQLPPYLKRDVDRLASFLEILPDDLRGAFEFRHASWFDDEVFALLESAGASLCIADSGSDHDTPLVATADFGYLRLTPRGLRRGRSSFLGREDPAATLARGLRFLQARRRGRRAAYGRGVRGPVRLTVCHDDRYLLPSHLRAHGAGGGDPGDAHRDGCDRHNDGWAGWELWRLRVSVWERSSPGGA